MDLPRLRPRLRLRSLLIAVAVMGLAIGVWQMWKRREYGLERAAHHASKEGIAREGSRQYVQMVTEARQEAEQIRREGDIAARLGGPPFADAYDKTAKYLARQAVEWCRTADSHARWKRRYLHVARYPWLPLPSGPDWPEAR